MHCHPSRFDWWISPTPQLRGTINSIWKVENNNQLIFYWKPSWLLPTVSLLTWSVSPILIASSPLTRMSVIRTLFTKADILLSNLLEKTSEDVNITDVLKENGYPRCLIQKRYRQQEHMTQRTTQQPNNHQLKSLFLTSKHSQKPTAGYWKTLTYSLVLH